MSSIPTGDNFIFVGTLETLLCQFGIKMFKMSYLSNGNLELVMGGDTIHNDDYCKNLRGGDLLREGRAKSLTGSASGTTRN